MSTDLGDGFSKHMIENGIPKAPAKTVVERTEAQCFMVEAAMFYGFEIIDDEAEKFSCTADQIIALVTAARKQGRKDAIEDARRELRKLDDPKHPANVIVCRIEAAVDDDVVRRIETLRGRLHLMRGERLQRYHSGGVVPNERTGYPRILR